MPKNSLLTKKNNLRKKFYRLKLNDTYIFCYDKFLNIFRKKGFRTFFVVYIRGE